MRTLLQHAAFGAILAGTLAVHVHGSGGDVLLPNGLIEPAIIRVGQSQGFEFRGFKSLSDADAPALVFDAPGCVQPSFVNVLSTTFGQETLGRIPPRPGYERRYIYIDHSWRQPNRHAVIFERSRRAVLAVFGLTRYVPLWHLLLVDAPLSCQAALSVNWRPVWDRDFLKAAQAREQKSRSY